MNSASDSAGSLIKVIWLIAALGIGSVGLAMSLAMPANVQVRAQCLWAGPSFVC